MLERIKANVLTPDNLARLVELVNEELEATGKTDATRINDMAREISRVEKKLGRLYQILETGKVDLDDVAPRLKSLRQDQRELEARRLELQTRHTAQVKITADVNEVSRQAEDLVRLVTNVSPSERKTFLRSFVRRIEYNRPDVAIHYTIPLPTNGKLTTNSEVLSFGELGSAGRIRTYDRSVNGRLLYH